MISDVWGYPNEITAYIDPPMSEVFFFLPACHSPHHTCPLFRPLDLYITWYNCVYYKAYHFK